MTTTLQAGRRSSVKNSARRKRTILSSVGRMMVSDKERLVTVPVRMFESQRKAIELFAAELGMEVDALVAAAVLALLCGGNQGECIVKETIEACDPSRWDEIRDHAETVAAEMLEAAEKSL